jgi:hypothetical protein
MLVHKMLTLTCLAAQLRNSVTRAESNLPGKSFPCNFFLAVVGFELRVSCLLGRRWQPVLEPDRAQGEEGAVQLRWLLTCRCLSTSGLGEVTGVRVTHVCW